MRGLRGVKPGDKIKTRRGWTNEYSVHEVERVTAKRAVCKDGTAFMIDSGVKVGSSPTRWGSFATDEDAAQAALDQRISAAQKEISCFMITSSNLEAAEAFIAAQKPESA